MRVTHSRHKTTNDVSYTAKAPDTKSTRPLNNNQRLTEAFALIGGPIDKDFGTDDVAKR